MKLADAKARQSAAEELGQTYLVEAAAGTGKTTLLVNRILTALRAGVRLTEMVAITFTEKAAGELKQRLHKELTKCPAQPWVAQALADLERAQVSTIHAFCAWLLKERPVEAGVDPEFQVADALQAELLIEEAWHDWLPREAATEKLDANPLRRLLAAGVSLAELWSLAQVCVNEREKLARAASGGDHRSVAIVLADITPHVQRLGELRQSCSSERDKLRRAIAAWESILPQFVTEETWQAESLVLLAPRLAPERDGESLGDRRRWKPDDHFNECRRLGVEVEELRGELMDGLFRDTLAWLGGFLERYDGLKRERVLLDFDDLLRRARDLLIRDPAVRGEWQQRFRHIFVDEFQDTDPLQTEIVMFLAEDGPAADQWTKCRLKPGKLFLVGDPKQSIYAFRRADIELYQAVANRLKVLTISTNFRSQSTILDWVNDVFKQIIQPPADGAYQPRYVAFEAAEPNRTNAPTVWQLRPTAEQAALIENSRNKTTARPLEAEAVARSLRHLHDVEARPWKDMAILFCTTTARECFTAALRRYDIPQRVVGGKDFYVRQEILTLASLLCCLDNPADKLNLVAVLRSPLFGWTDDQVYSVARETGLDYVHQAPADPQLAAAFLLLRDLHAQRHTLSVAAFTEAALNVTRMCEAFFTTPDGEQCVMNLLKALELARALEAAGERTIRAVVRRLRRSVLEGWDEESSPASEEGEDFVRLLTVHKAKGLEFGVVVVADLAGESQDQRVQILQDPANRQLEARLGTRRTRGFAAADARQARRDAAEEVRLLYVAATRAKDRLIIPWFFSKAKPGRSRHLADAIEQLGADRMEIRRETDFAVHPVPETPVRVRVTGESPDDPRIAARRAWVGSRQALLERAAQPLARSRPSQLAHESEPLPNALEEGVPVAREQAIQRGVVVHAALEHAGTLAEAQAFLLAAGLSEEDQLGAVAMVERLYGSPLWQRLCQANECHREVPFSVQRDDGLMEGKIDLLFREGERWTLVDYKTDRQPDPERYRAQLQAYAEALAAVAGVRVAEKLLFFLSTGAIHPVD